MREVLAKLPVSSLSELKAFELELCRVSNARVLTRAMAYKDFRITVLKCQQSGSPAYFRTILPDYHVIMVEDGVATLYRNCPNGGGDVDMEETGDGDSEGDCRDRGGDGNSERGCEGRPRKKAKGGGCK
jgi:hypothetical protein